MNTHRILLIALLAWVTAACSDGLAENTSVSRMLMTGTVQLDTEGHLPSLAGAIAWVNSPELTGADLRGKVVLVQFWTYTCVNWRRTLPYVQAWADKYRSQGLVVVGVHTPEFGFEKDADNVRQAVKEMEIDYPIALDSRRRIWDAFNNEYWPALYFVDAQGRIRHHQFGEGDYAQSERVIQELLVEAGNTMVTRDLVSVDPHGLEVAADWRNQKSPETYVGYWQAQNFASSGGAMRGVPDVYGSPAQLKLNEWALKGNWTVEGEAAVLNKTGGRIVYRFHSRDLNLVMSPGSLRSSIRVRVTIDGQPPGVAHGTDVDAMGYGTVSEPRTYQLIRQPEPIRDHDCEIEFLEPAVKVFDFTFG